MTPADTLTAVTTKGFAVVPDVVSRTEAAEFAAVLDCLVAEDLAHPDARRRADDWMVFNPYLRDLGILELICRPAIVDHVEAILGPTAILYACVTSSMPPAGTNYSARVHVDSPRVVPGYPTNVGVMICLDDFTVENGATSMLPGSFERLEPPSDEEFERGAELLVPSAGSLIVFNARTWHRGGVNRTDRPRHAITANYCRAFMRQHFDIPRMIPAEVADTLTETQRRILGYHVRMPTSLEDYYVDEESQRLYRSGQG
jgi:ectoine hydroxylase-related dioxygenase (phytanoyl-CoA dioxygenase family)